MHIRAIDVHIKLQLIAHALDVLEAFLIIGPRAADPDLGFVLVERCGRFTEGADDAFEC